MRREVGYRLFEAVGGRGLAGIVAVLAEAVFELLDTQGQEGNRVLEGSDRLHDRVGSQVIESLYLLACQHNVLTSNEIQRFRTGAADFAQNRPEQLQNFNKLKNIYAIC